MKNALDPQEAARLLTIAEKKLAPARHGIDGDPPADDKHICLDDIIHGTPDFVSGLLRDAGAPALDSTAEARRVLKLVATNASPAGREDDAAFYNAKADTDIIALNRRIATVPLDHPRFYLVARNALARFDSILIHGPADAGKSHFVRRVLCASEDVRGLYPHIMHIDGRALGMRQPAHLLREMLWSQFGLNDDEFLSFKEAADFREGGIERDLNAEDRDPLFAYLQKRFPDGRGVIVLDHMDRLYQDGTIDKFLSNSLMAGARKLGLKVIFVQRAAPDAKRMKKLGIQRNLYFPRYGRREVAAWLAAIGAKHGAPPEVSAVNLLTEIGARPALMDEFRAFLQSAQRFEQRSLVKFAFHRLRLGHLPDCDRFFRVVRCHAPVLSALMKSGGGLTDDVVGKASKECLASILLTGAVRRDGEGRLVYQSKMHEKRMRALFNGEALATPLIRGSQSDIAARGSWPYLMKYREYSADAIAKSIAAEPEPAAALKQFQDFLKRLRMDTHLYIRDPFNARLWAPFRHMDKLAPFHSAMQPEFARAIQTGEPVKCEDGRWFVPVPVDAGLIAMVLRVNFQNAPSEWVEMAQLRALECLIEGVRITLAQILQRLAFLFDRQDLAKSVSRSREDFPGHNGLLKSFGCVGWAIMDRNAKSGAWYTSKIGATGAESPASHLADMFDVVNSEGVDARASHYSGHGVVLNGPSLTAIFPMLSRPSDAVYLQPVGRCGDHDRLVMFLFDLSIEKAKPISGLLQRRLGELATNLAA